MDFNPVLVAKILDISPKIAAAYATKTSKTLVRDLGVLKKMQLIDRGKRKGVRAKRELIFALLSEKANQ